MILCFILILSIFFHKETKFIQISLLWQFGHFCRHSVPFLQKFIRTSNYTPRCTVEARSHFMTQGADHLCMDVSWEAAPRPHGLSTLQERRRRAISTVSASNLTLERVAAMWENTPAATVVLAALQRPRVPATALSMLFNWTTQHWYTDIARTPALAGMIRQPGVPILCARV